MSADEYRIEFDLPAGLPLASESYRAAHEAKIRRMQAQGLITYDHLPTAVEASRRALHRPKRGEALEKQRAIALAAARARQLPPGAKRADGRDADRAREYQRQYRQRRR